MTELLINDETSIANAQRRKQSEELILRVAEEVFAQKGYNGATITEIAQKADLPKTNIHYYFSNKKSLYECVINSVFTEWLEAADKFSNIDDPVIALSAYINAKMDLARSRPNGSKVWANEIINNAPMIRSYLETRLCQWTQSREQWINKWIEEGRLRPVEPRYLLYLIWASTQHYADFSTQITVLNGGEPLNDEQFECAKKTVISIILHGLLPKSAD
jgi:TetR/AcrR family transcriptional regulator